MTKLVGLLALAILIFIVGTTRAQTATGNYPLLIVEVQTGSAASATEEFVELYNPTDLLISANTENLKLQYKSATGVQWLTKATLTGDVQPRGRYLIATADYADDADFESGLGLASGGGHLRLISDSDVEANEHDQMAWGDAQSPQAQAAPAPPAGQSLKRLVDEDGLFIDTDQDSLDFGLSQTPSPQSSQPLLVEQDEFSPSTGNLDSPAVASSPTSTSSSRPSTKLELTELFIDPDKPLTDADDEFVEIYNPTKETVDLEDYVLQTGSAFSYSFKVPAISIKSGQYLALFSIDTGLILSNSGGAARLIGPDGKTVFTVPAYEPAKPGLAWAAISGEWQWTDRPTPNQANAAGSSDSTSAGEDLSSGRVLSSTATQDGRTVYEDPPAGNPKVNNAVVAGVGTMALLYAGYEYRYDLGNAVHKLRRYLASRRGGGTGA